MLNPPLFQVRNTTKGSEKGEQGVVFMRKRGVGPLSFRRGESGARFAKPGGSKRPTPPDYTRAVLMALQIYAGLSLVGGPDPRDAPCQFIPFDPFLAGGMFYGSAAARRGTTARYLPRGVMKTVFLLDTMC